MRLSSRRSFVCCRFAVPAASNEDADALHNGVVLLERFDDLRLYFEEQVVVGGRHF
jgi:hypothetical protein